MQPQMHGTERGGAKQEGTPMAVIDAIYARRSVRSYGPDPVDGASVRALLDAAVQAPSAMNAQPWGFVVVQDRALLRSYSDRAKSMLLGQMGGSAKERHYSDLLRSESFNIFYDAGTLIVICGPEGDPYAEADCWLAAQNLQLAALARGLGTCCIGFALPLLRDPKVVRELGIPPGQKGFAALIVGVPRAAPPPVPRSSPVVLSWLG
jgi:nitroreductase